MEPRSPTLQTDTLPSKPPGEHIKNLRHYFTNKGLSSECYGFSSSHVWMGELDHKESWVPENWCFWSVVLDKTLENPMDCKEIKPVNPKGNQSWILVGRTDAEAEVPILWPPDAKKLAYLKRPWCWERLKAGEGNYRRWDGWMASLTLCTWVWASSGVDDGQGNLACCSPWGHQESDTTELTDWPRHQDTSKYIKVRKSDQETHFSKSCPNGLNTWFLTHLED